MMLSQYFSEEEFIRSETAKKLDIDNCWKDPDHKENAIRLCKTILEPLRFELGKPVKVTSGYRCPELNKAVGGVKTSAHLEGRAADITVAGYTPKQLQAFIKSKVDQKKIPMPDQVICEASWVHIGIAREGEKPRGQFFKI